MNEKVSRSYAEAFGGRLSPGRAPALLIVDAVLAYLEVASPFFAASSDAVGANEFLISVARDRCVPVIFTHVEYDSGGLTGGLFYRKVPGLKMFARGSPLAQFSGTLSPKMDEIVISKRYPSAFFGTDLATTLHVMGIDTLLITGFSTSGCVRATALDALCHGFVPLVVKDACGDRDSGQHEANLLDLQTKYAEVIDTEQAYRVLEHYSKGPSFGTTSDFI